MSFLVFASGGGGDHQREMCGIITNVFDLIDKNPKKKYRKISATRHTVADKPDPGRRCCCLSGDMIGLDGAHKLSLAVVEAREYGSLWWIPIRIVVDFNPN